MNEIVPAPGFPSRGRAWWAFSALVAVYLGLVWTTSPRPRDIADVPVETVRGIWVEQDSQIVAHLDQGDWPQLLAETRRLGSTIDIGWKGEPFLKERFLRFQISEHRQYKLRLFTRESLHGHMRCEVIHEFYGFEQESLSSYDCDRLASWIEIHGAEPAGRDAES